MGLSPGHSDPRFPLCLRRREIFDFHAREGSWPCPNRLATEARKYGLGLLASQDLEHFTRDILTNVAAKLMLMHAETAIRTTAGRLLLEKGQLRALREPFVGLVKLGGGGWSRVRVRPYYERKS